MKIRVTAQDPVEENVFENAALLVVDVQNAFCDRPDAAPRATADMRRAVENINVLIRLARAESHPVILTRMVYDPEYTPDTVVRRNSLIHGGKDFLRPGSSGVEFYRIAPEPSDFVFEKHSYDAFINPGFEVLLKQLDVATLVVCGFYLDVCVDSLVRSAYQKGYETAVVEDATLSVFFEKKQMMDFMKTLYNTRFTDTRTCQSVGKPP